MQTGAISGQRIRFGEFEVDLRSEELRKSGAKLKLQGQPLKILAILLAHPGELVSREELRQELWPEDTFVDFETGLNSAVLKLRQALGDSAESPRFVETLPRRGYRFIAPITVPEVPSLSASAGGAETERSVKPRGLGRLLITTAVCISVLALLLILLGNVRGMRQRWLGNSKLSADEAPQIRSVAVLPLENLSSDPQQEYFAEGITDELTTDLAKLSALKVISRTSAIQIKSAKRPLPEIAKELNLDAIVEGSVERSGGRVRISAQLIDARHDGHLWAESYDRDARDLLALQTDVARAIASAIRVKLTPQEQARLASSRPKNLEAEESYLQGRHELGKWTTEGFKKGLTYFQQAVHEDPTFAQAWAGLADAYYELGLETWPRAESWAEAKAAAQKAMQLDETLSDAHVSLATLALGQERSPTEAVKELQRAIALDPSNARAHQIYGRILLSHERFDEAIAELQRAEELDPLTPKMKNNLGVAHFFAGHDDQALAWFQQVPDPDLDSERRHRRMAEIYDRKGMQKEAMAEFVTSLRFGGKKDLAATVQRKFQSSGYADATKTLLLGEVGWAERQAKGKELPDNAFWIARDYAILGERGKALAWLEAAIRHQSPGALDLKTDARLAEFCSDPHVQELMRRRDLSF